MYVIDEADAIFRNQLFYKEKGAVNILGKKSHGVLMFSATCGRDMLQALETLFNQEIITTYLRPQYLARDGTLVTDT